MATKAGSSKAAAPAKSSTPVKVTAASPPSNFTPLGQAPSNFLPASQPSPYTQPFLGPQGYSPGFQQFSQAPAQQSLQMQSNQGNIEATRQLGLAAQSAGLGAAIGQGVGSGNRQLNATAAAKAQLGQTTGKVGSRGSYVSVENALAGGRAANLATQAQAWDNFWASVSSQRDNANQQALGSQQLQANALLQGREQQAQMNLANTQAGAQLEAARIQAQAQLGTAAYGMQGNILSSLFGSNMGSGTGGRYW